MIDILDHLLDIAMVVLIFMAWTAYMLGGLFALTVLGDWALEKHWRDVYPHHAPPAIVQWLFWPLTVLLWWLALTFGGASRKPKVL